MVDSQQSSNNSAASSAMLQQDSNRFSIEGTVDFSTVPALVKQVKHALGKLTAAEGELIIIDLSRVSSCNSAALALMLEIVKFGNKIKLNLKFENIPDSLLKIAAAYGIETEIREFLNE